MATRHALSALAAVVALAAGPRPARAAQWPEHSWATVPVFLHSSTMALLVPNASDLAIMARFPLVTIEKWQGCALNGFYPGPPPDPAAPHPTQAVATLATARALKALRPRIAVATWTDSLRVYANATLNPSAHDLDDQFCVNFQDTPFLEAHAADYLLHNTSGGLALESLCHFHVYDHTKPAVRDLWRDACLNMTRTGLVDGCGADASQQSGTYVLGLAPDVSAAWTAAHVLAVADTTRAVLSEGGGFVIGKLGEQLGSVNAVLQEGCTASNETVNALRDATARAVAAGVRYIYECHGTSDESNLAAFLCGAGRDHYFGFGPWVTEQGGFDSAWLPAFERPLGAPMADAVYDAATATWTRLFASGTSVLFNAATNVGAVSWATTRAAAPSFVVANDRFERDGAPFVPFSGSFHYHRGLPSYWADRLQRMAAMGLNTVQTYVPWNFHELTARAADAPTFDFAGERNISAFLSAAADAGLLVFLRSGPYICGEHDFGGFPAFLLDAPGISSDLDLRTNNSAYLAFVDRWLTRLFAEVRPHLYSNGGNVAMVQIENEYGSYGNTGGNGQDLAYMEHLRDFARAQLGGPDAVQLYTTDGGDVGYLSHGATPGVFATGDGGCGDTCDKFFAAEDQFNTAGTRAHTDSEFYTGWLTHWGEGMANTSTAGTVGGVATLLAAGAGFDLYMAYGGTNFGFRNGANGGGADFEPVITSYDYDSPLSEGGIHGYSSDGDKFQAFVQLLSYWRNETLPAEPALPPIAAYGALAMTQSAPLLGNLALLSPAPFLNQAAPRTMESCGQRHGYALYRTVIPGGHDGRATDLVLAGLGDRAEAFVNGVSAGVTYRPEKGAGTLTIAAGLVRAGATLDILVENMGHINYGRGFFDPKGLTGASFGGAALRSNWTIYPLELDFNASVARLPFAPFSGPPPAVPTFFRGSLAVPSAPADTYLSLCGWTKGTMWINGHHVGRYWETSGPQHAFYIPAAFLVSGANDVVVLEQHAANAAVAVTFGALPDFTGAVCKGLGFDVEARPARERPERRRDAGAAAELLPPRPSRNTSAFSASACAVPAAGTPVTLQPCATTPAANVQLTVVAKGPRQSNAVAFAVASNPELCVAADLSQSTAPLVLRACAAVGDRSQDWLWFETPGAQLQPPAALMALGALPNAVGKCFDVTGGGGSPGQAVGIYGCTGNSNQHWSADAAGRVVAAVNPDLCLAAC